MHAHDTEARVRTRLYNFHSVGISIQPVPVHMKQQLETTTWRRRRNLKKRQIAWEGMGNTRARLANTANRAPNMHTHHHQVRIFVCTVCFQGNIHTNPVHSSEHRVVTTDYGAGGYLNNNPNYELLGK